MSARIVMLGLAGSGRTLTVARLVDALIHRTSPPRFVLPALERELKARGLTAERQDAPPASRTTRQLLDDILVRGELMPRFPDPRSFFVEDESGRLVEIVDTAGAHVGTDPSPGDPLGPIERLASADGVCVCLGKAWWSEEEGPALLRTERDRLEQWLRRIAERRREMRRRALPLGVILVGREAGGAPLPEGVPATSLLRVAGEPGGSLDAFVADLPGERTTGELSLVVEALTPALAPGSRRDARRALWLRRGAVAALLAWVGVTAAGMFDLMRFTDDRPLDGVAAEAAHLRGSEAARRRWRVYPPVLWIVGGAQERADLAHTGHLVNELTQVHPAMLEPVTACELETAQYRTAADGIRLALDRGLPRARAAELERRLQALRLKTRVAAMPSPHRTSLRAWEELYADALRQGVAPEVTEHVIVPRIRPVLVTLASEARREALADPAYPGLFEHVAAARAGHPPLAEEAFEAAEAEVWRHAEARVQALVSLSEGGPLERVERLLALIEQAPRPRPRHFDLSVGTWLARDVLQAAELAALPPGWSGALRRALGPSGWIGFLSEVPSTYATLAEQGPDRGPGLLQALVRGLALVPGEPLAPPLRAEVEAFREHLSRLSELTPYSLRVAHAEASERLDSMFDSFDMRVKVSATHAPARGYGPLKNQREASFRAFLFEEGTFPWRAFDRIDVVIEDDEDVKRGFHYEDKGSLFGLHRVQSPVEDPNDRGSFRIETDPAPPAPFAFEAWPQPIR
ncbi:MAG: hypothetical protein ACYS22_03435 [Planctomycetota bacterium]